MLFFKPFLVIFPYYLALHIHSKYGLQYSPQTYSSKLSFESAWGEGLHNAVFSPPIVPGPARDLGSSPIDLAVGLVLKTHAAF